MQSGPKMETPRHRAVVSFLATFAYAWVMVGLVTGTLVLVLFVRAIVSAVHGLGWGQAAENRVLIGVILLFVVASFLVTRSLVRRLYRVPSLRTRRLALGALVVPGLLSMYAWSNPTRMLASMAGGESTSLQIQGGAEFVFGPYPDDARIAELKKEGITAIVTLQHPSVLVELQGIAAEKEAAQRMGVTLIHAPMLPWVSDNRAALEKIRLLARGGTGKYYVHCGLGRDRVNVVKRVIEQEARNQDVKFAQSRDLKPALTLDDRTEPFERGRLFRLRPSVYLVPKPNEDEFFGFLLQHDAGRVLLVFDPADSAQASWLAKAQAGLKDYAVTFEVVPFSETDAVDAGRVAMLVSRIRSLPGRATIVVPATPFGSGTTERDTKTAQAILRNFGVSWALPTDQRSSSQSGGTPGK